MRDVSRETVGEMFHVKRSREGEMFHVKQKRVAFRCPAGACLLCRLPTLLFVYLPSPIPPTPFPAGKGEIFGFLMQGAPPLASPGLNPDGTGSIGGAGAPAPLRLSPGGTGYFLPRQCFLPPSPRPALAERSSRREGGDYKFILPGASPPAPLHLTACDTYSSCHAGARRGRALGVASSAQNR